MEINLVGSLVVEATLGGITNLSMGDRGSINILTPLSVTEPSGAAMFFDPLAYAPRPFGEITGRRVIASSISDDGRFTLAFENGSVLAVPPFEDSESVHIFMPDSRSMVVVGLGGELSVWD